MGLEEIPTNHSYCASQVTGLSARLLESHTMWLLHPSFSGLGCWHRRTLILGMLHVTSAEFVLMVYSSDGDYEDWADARDLCATLWPDEPTDALWERGD
jgi:hypothetical protein